MGTNPEAKGLDVPKSEIHTSERGQKGFACVCLHGSGGTGGKTH